MFYVKNKKNTWRSCCWALSCCCSSNNFCIFSWVFCSCNNCSWYCCWRAGGRESCGSWGSCAPLLAKRPADVCSTWVCTDLGFASGIHSLFETCRDHLSPRVVPNFVDRIKQIDIASVRRLCTVWNIDKIHVYINLFVWTSRMQKSVGIRKCWSSLRNNLNSR